MSFYYIYGIASYPLFLYLGMLMLAKCLDRRRYCHLKEFLCGTVFTAIVFIVYYAIDMNRDAIGNGYLLTTMKVLSSFIAVIFGFVLLLIAFNGSITAYIYCLMSGICLQHFTQQFGDVIYKLTLNENENLNFIINVLAYIVFYGLFYFRLRHKGKEIIRIDEKKQFFLASLVITIAIFAMPYATTASVERVTAILISFFSSVISFLGYLLENQLVQYKAAQMENAASMKLIEEQKKQYEIDKDAIDEINIKAHDLRHQIEDGFQLDEKYKSSLIVALKTYDHLFHTGNEALDMVLSKIALRCQKENIELTSMADGGSLGFLKNEEIYSLFGNLLDNAYESVLALENKNKKVISLLVYQEKGVITILETNYYTGSDELNTHKSDRRNHGFGLLSIRQIVSKYDGVVNISKKSGIFTIKINFFSDGLKK